MIAEPYERYLRLLGLSSLPSGLEGLNELVTRHLVKVPFENVSKLLLFRREGRGRVPALSDFLDGIEHHDLGGTCYTNNPFLAELLAALGYETELFGADMTNPNVHTCIRVRVGPVKYHVDVGYGAPFREPIPLDRLPYELPHGDLRYVFDRSASRDGHEMAVLSGAARRHGYFVHEPPRSPDFFRQTVLESYEPGKTFMTQLRITRFFDNYAVELRDGVLVTYRGCATVRRPLNTVAELKSALANDLKMPRCPIEDALDTLERITGRPPWPVSSS